MQTVRQMLCRICSTHVTCISSVQLSDSPADSHIIHGRVSVSSRTTRQISHHVATVYTALIKTQATVVWFTADNSCRDRRHDLSKNNTSFFKAQ
jgi:hypothetical protein